MEDIMKKRLFLFLAFLSAIPSLNAGGGGTAAAAFGGLAFGTMLGAAAASDRDRVVYVQDEPDYVYDPYYDEYVEAPAYRRRGSVEKRRPYRHDRRDDRRNKRKNK